MAPRSQTSDPKPSLTTLPPEILLQIADYFLEDYLLWKTQLRYLRKATFHLDLCPYLNMARTHSSLWNVLNARRFAKGVLKNAAASTIVTTAKAPNVEGCLEASRRRRRRRMRVGGDLVDREEEGDAMERTPDGMEWCEVLKEQ
jgi:hypothetical protein